MNSETPEGGKAPSEPRDLLQVDPKERAIYGRFSLVHLTSYSIHWLHAWGIPSTYENISVLNARLFPEDFGMSGFHELPDALRTNRSLLQMRPKYRGLAMSDPRRGVFLTERGREVAHRVLDAIGAPTLEGRQVPEGAMGADPRRPNKDLERSYNPAEIIAERRGRLLFRHFQDGQLKGSDVVHLLGLLGVYDHSPPIEVRKALRELRIAAAAADDAEFLQFLDAVQERFRDYLSRSDALPKR